MTFYKILLITIVALASYALFYGFLIEPRMVKIRKITIKLRSLPPSCRGLRIAFFSDLHAGFFYPPAHIEKVFNKLLATAPDLICIGGDFVEERTPITDEAFRRKLLEQLSRLKAPLGTYTVLGNHDTETHKNYFYVRDILEEAGIKLLQNEAVDIEGLCLIGLKESYHQTPDLDAATNCPGQKSTQGSTSRIIMMHQPDDIPDTATLSDGDLILSGHSHKGQITLFGLPLYTVQGGRKRIYGHYLLPSGAQQITSSGLGTVHIYARFSLLLKFYSLL